MHDSFPGCKSDQCYQTIENKCISISDLEKYIYEQNMLRDVAEVSKCCTIYTVSNCSTTPSVSPFFQ